MNMSSMVDDKYRQKKVLQPKGFENNVVEKWQKGICVVIGGVKR